MPAKSSRSAQEATAQEVTAQEVTAQEVTAQQDRVQASYAEGLAWAETDPCALTAALNALRKTLKAPRRSLDDHGAESSASGPRAVAACPEVRLQRLGAIGAETTAWLSPGRVPLGSLTVLAGASGAGKTFVALDLAARVTRGDGWPRICGPGDVCRPGEVCGPDEKSGDESPHSKGLDEKSGDESPHSKGSVVVFNAKDSTTRVLRPRLDAAGADVDRVTVVSRASHAPLDAAADDGQALARRLTALTMAIQDTGDCRLAVVDDVESWLGDCQRSLSEARLGEFFRQLGAIAAVTHTAVVCLLRLNATPEGRLAYRELTPALKAADAVWLVADEPDRPSRKLLLPVKNNLAPAGAANAGNTGLATSLAGLLAALGPVGGLAFRLTPAAMGAAVVAWEACPPAATAGEVMSCGAGWVERRRQRDDAAEWLIEALADGPVASKQLFGQAAECGLSGKTLRRAAGQLGIKPFKQAFCGSWFWSAAVCEGGHLLGESSHGHGAERLAAPPDCRLSAVAHEDGHMHGESSCQHGNGEPMARNKPELLASSATREPVSAVTHEGGHLHGESSCQHGNGEPTARNKPELLASSATREPVSAVAHEVGHMHEESSCQHGDAEPMARNKPELLANSATRQPVSAVAHEVGHMHRESSCQHGDAEPAARNKPELLASSATRQPVSAVAHEVGHMLGESSCQHGNVEPTARNRPELLASSATRQLRNRP